MKHQTYRLTLCFKMCFSSARRLAGEEVVIQKLAIVFFIASVVHMLEVQALFMSLFFP